MREGKNGDDLLGGLEESCVTAVADFKNASTRYNAQYWIPVHYRQPDQYDLITNLRSGAWTILLERAAATVRGDISSNKKRLWLRA